ncbi:uncharacterized protein LOC109829262 isoform X2 [Asparagus officinalis]|uniref:uncharacterized protein LOC109829262 isoform X2 n=1 Tax=Asparagus officinalis TaxID=4686 RepID=UPI00098E0B2D|nr:uncharacterized protein LOC109829262 isoform X2 [Asparagus officinalis]
MSGKKSSTFSSSIPSKMRETVQNLKEIVNCSEQEIYAMLRECNMDPNEAVQRLLAQDTFHEVKSKREKKKEIKVTGESKSQRVSSSSSSRGVRGGADQSGRDSEVIRSKHAHTKENAARVSHTSAALGSRGSTSNSSWGVAPSSYSDPLGDVTHFPGLSGHISSQPSSTVQHQWLGVPGQLSMADIVKMGRAQRKPSNTSAVETELCNSLSHKAVASNSQGNVITVTPYEANQDKHSSQDNVFQVSEVGHEPSTLIGQHESLEEWTLVDHSADEGSAVLVDVSAGSSVYHEPSVSSSSRIDEVDSHLNPHVDDIQKSGQVSGRNLTTGSTTSDAQLRVDSSDESSCSDDASFRNDSSYQQQEAEFVQDELSSDLQHLNIQKKEQSAASSEEKPAVVIPGHLQVTNEDFSRLSFGSFRSGVGSSLAGEVLPKPLKSNFGVDSITENAQSVGYQDTRVQEYYNTEQLRTTADDRVSLINDATTLKNYDVSTSQPEHSRNDTIISEQQHQYNIPSVSGFAVSGTTKPDYAANCDVQANTQMQNLSLPTNLKQPHIDSSPSNLLSGNAQSLQGQDLPFLHSLTDQSISTQYRPSTSSFSGPTFSSPEVLMPGLFSNFHSIPQTTSSHTISSGAALHQHLYSQPTLPLGPLTNMYTYPVLPQNIAYMPFSGNSPFHQSPASLQSAAMKYGLPQFKSSMSLPTGSGYGGFGSSTNISGAFLQNPSNIAAGSSIGYEEALRSQYKESIALHQGDNSSLWHSRPLSAAVPPSNFYGLQGPSQNKQQHSSTGSAACKHGNDGVPKLVSYSAGWDLSRASAAPEPTRGSQWFSGPPTIPAIPSAMAAQLLI